MKNNKTITKQKLYKKVQNTFKEIRPWVKYGWEMILIVHEIIKTENPLKNETTQKPIELFVQEDKFWIQEVSPSRTEIRIRPNTDDHDLLTKLNKAQKFLSAGDKLKVTVMFRGREMSRKQAGRDLLVRVTNILEDVAKIDKEASLEGKRMSMILSPR